MEEPKHISEVLRQRVVVDFTNAPSRTKSEFAEECNINNIVGRALKTGVMPSGTRKPLFEDFTEVKDYTETQRIIATAEQNFMQLAPEVREKFGNNVAELLDFIDNPENAKEAAELGLIAPIEVEAAVEEAAAAPQAEAPAEAQADDSIA